MPMQGAYKNTARRFRAVFKFFLIVCFAEAYFAKTFFRWTKRGRPSSLTMLVSPWIRGIQ